MANTISVVLKATTDQAVGAMKGFKQSVADADGAFGKVKAGAGSAFESIKANAGIASVAVVGAVGAMAHKSIEAASRLGESVNAVNVTFGQSAAGIKDLGEQAAESVGLSNAEFNGLAVQFSSFADTIAGKGGDVVGTIDDMTHRAADFASVMNIDVAEAARLFQSGLAGETEPLKKFGIDLSAAAVDAHALEKGMVDSKSEMTEAIKVQARYSLLMEETEKTAGDFANTSDGLANSQRILSAKIEDTAAKAGKQLLPAMAAITSAMSDLIPIAGTAAAKAGGFFTAATELAYDFGAALADVTEAIPGISLSGSGMHVEDTLHELEQMEAGAAGLIEKYAKAGMTAAEFADVLRDNGIEFTENNIAANLYAKQLAAAAEVTDDVTESTDELTEAVDRTADGMAETDAMIDQVNDTYNAQVEAVEAAAEALEELTEDMIDAVGAAFNLETSVLNLETAYDDYQESVLETTGILNDSTVSDRDKEQALRDVRTQEIALAEEALATAEAYAQEMGAADGSAESAQLQKEKLQELQAAFPELRDELQLYIDKLNAVPGVIRTRFEITATGARVTPTGDTIGGGMPQYASGGFVSGPVGKPQLAIVHGGEYITPHNQLAGGWSGAGAAMAGTTYAATINNNGRDVGIEDISRAFAIARLSR